jgi:putative CocE/NonD family hydrolase
MKRAILPLAIALSAPALWPQGVEYVKAHYTKYEDEITMRDGKKLFTAVYAPKDTSHPYPILLMRTPYGVSPYGEDNYKTSLGPSEIFAKDGFIFVYQDVRGSWMSEGEFVNMRPHNPAKRSSDIDESTDTWDTIDWLVKHVPNNSGRVGMWGISYPGFYAAAGMIDAHPALKAVSPQAPIADWFIGDDFHHNGALYLPHAFRFFYGFGHPRPEPTTEAPPLPAATHSPDGYDYFLRLGPLANVDEKVFKGSVAFWRDIVDHPNYDEFWQARNLLPHLKNIQPAVMTVGGWFDAEDLFGALNTYKSVERQSPGAHNILVMGPWYHGGWSGSSAGDHLGNVPFGSKTSEFFREKIEFPFFKYYLKEQKDFDLPGAYVFETGSNQWRRYAEWPPKTAAAKSLYFRAGGKLSFDPPDDETAFDEYTSDPAKPVPYIGETSLNMTREHMAGDQRFAATRPDVLVYETEPLTADVTFSGPLEPRLFVSTTGTDSDWVVKLIDVYPDTFPDPDPNPTGVKMGGYQQLVRGELMRGRFRHSYEKPEPFTPGKMDQVDYTMPDVCHDFRRGHRIMVQVQSSWFPLADRNPQKFVDIYSAKVGDFQKATERVYRARTTPSSVRVQIMP